MLESEHTSHKEEKIRLYCNTYRWRKNEKQAKLDMEARIKKQDEEIKHLKVDKTDFFIFLNNLINSTESGCYWFNAWRISDEVPC